MNRRTAVGALIALAVIPANAHGQGELHRVLARVLAQPIVTAEPGFTAKLLVPPGELYDPLFILPRDDGSVLVNDDGGEEAQGTGSRIVSISPAGHITVVVPTTKALPMTGFDIAPNSFGKFGGQFITLAQPKVGEPGLSANHVIQRINPADQNTASIVCTLPSNGNINHGTAGIGSQARFGPIGTPFANRFFALTDMNDTIYEVTGDGNCRPFVTLASYGAPGSITFSPDGSAMLVSVTRGGESLTNTNIVGEVVRVSPDGTVDPKPVVTGLIAPTGLDFAPPNFGAYGGQLFIVDSGASFEVPVPMTQPIKADGVIYRVAPDGALKKVAAGFMNPVGLKFVGHALWVTDVNGDFIAGRRELPDGFIVVIDAK